MIRKFGELFWSFILIFLNLFLVYLLVTDKYTIFVHPKFKYHLIFSIIVLFSFLILQIYKGIKKERIISLNKTFIFIILPIILLLIPNKKLLGNSYKNRGVKVSEFENLIPKETRKVDLPMEGKPHEKISVEDYLNSENYQDLNSKEGRDFKNAIFTLTEDLEGSVGGHLTLEGFVYKEDFLEKNQFILARLLITCCTADAQVVGFICEMENGENLEEETWVSVDVTISKTIKKNNVDGKEKETAKLIVDELRKIERPLNPYIYP